MCGEIDSCDDINEIKLAVKCYLKLYLATLETINDLYKI
jgi:hypothetical protein